MRVFKGLFIYLFIVSKMLNNFETAHLIQMLLAAFCESEVFNNMRHMDEMLLVFDGLGNSNIPQLKQNGNKVNQVQIYRLLQPQKIIRSFGQNVFDHTNVETKKLITRETKLHTYAEFTKYISRYYQLRPLKRKDAAILFSRLMYLLECNPLKMSQVVQLKHQSKSKPQHIEHKQIKKATTINMV